MAGRKRGRIIGYIALQLRYIRTEKHPNFFVFSPFLLFFYTLYRGVQIEAYTPLILY